MQNRKIKLQKRRILLQRRRTLETANGTKSIAKATNSIAKTCIKSTSWALEGLPKQQQLAKRKRAFAESPDHIQNVNFPGGACPQTPAFGLSCKALITITSLTTFTFTLTPLNKIYMHLNARTCRLRHFQSDNSSEAGSCTPTVTPLR